MAQLDVQPKKRSPTWLWVIIILVILGILFMLYRGYNRSYHPTELKTVPADSVKTDTDKTDIVTIDSAKTDTAKMDTTRY
jgi:uncharacterized protein YpmB